MKMFVKETPANPSLPRALLKYCVFSCTRCWFFGLMTFCFSFTVYTLYSNILPLQFSLCLYVCVCIQTLVAGCSYSGSSFIMSSQASQSLRWAEWNKHMSWWRPRQKPRTGTPARCNFYHWNPQSTAVTRLFNKIFNCPLVYVRKKKLFSTVFTFFSLSFHLQENIKILLINPFELGLLKMYLVKKWFGATGS